MTNKQLVVSVATIILLVVVIVGVIYVRTDRSGMETTDRMQDVLENGDDSGITQRLVVTHEWDGTAHEYAGSIVLPTPCHTLSVEASVAESFPEQITLQITTASPPTDTVCTQVLDRASFSFLVSASQTAQLVRIVLNGAPVDFEIFEEAKG